MWWNEEDAKEFSEFFTTSRTYLNVLIGTSVKPDQMIKAIREDYTKKIEIKWLASYITEQGENIWRESKEAKKREKEIFDSLSTN